MKNLEVSLRDLGIILAFGSGSGGGALVSGPSNRTTTNTAIPTWNGTAGNSLNNSDLLYSSQALSVGTANASLSLAANGTGSLIGQRNWSIQGAATGNASMLAVISGLTNSINYLSFGYDNTTGSGYLRSENNNVAWVPMRYGASIHSFYNASALLATITGSGNLILSSTGTDNANGRIQLASATTIAGGIGFGSDTAFYRNQAGGFAVDTTTTNSQINFLLSGGSRCYIQNNSGALSIVTTAGQLTLSASANLSLNALGGTYQAILSGVNGSLSLPGKLLSLASSTASASQNIPSGTAPTSPTDGDFWYDGTNLKFRNGATSRTITWV